MPLGHEDAETVNLVQLYWFVLAWFGRQYLKLAMGWVLLRSQNVYITQQM